MAISASRLARTSATVCYVAVEHATEELAGFYTLSASSVLLEDYPGDHKKLPRYPTVPVVRIGRLAVDKSFHGKGIGGLLVGNAIERVVAGGIGVHAIAVDAKDAKAVAFYEHLGFIALPSDPQILFLPISEAVKSLL